MLAVKSVEVDYLGFWKKRKQRRGRMRRRTGRWKHLPTVFPVAHTVIGEHGGEEWPAKVLWRRRRQLRHRAKERRAARYGEGLGLIFGLGFGTQDFAKTAWGAVGLRDGYASGGGAHGVGGGGGGASDGSGWKSKFWVCKGGGIVEPTAHKRGMFLCVEGGILKLTSGSCLTAVNNRARGTAVNCPLYDYIVIVINPLFNPILLFGLWQHYSRYQIWSTPVLSSIVLARITFFPP